MIFKNQPLTIEVTFTDDGAVVDLTGASVEYDYYSPGDCTIDGVWSATITDAANGVTEYKVNQNVLDTVGTWKIQPSFTKSGEKFYAEAECFYVSEIGVC